MKSFKSLPTVALAAMVGIAAAALAASPADAQKAKAKAKSASPESRVKMCMDMYKGQYRNQGEGWLFQHGYCLSNVAGWGGAAPQPSAKPGRGTYYYGAPSAQYGGTGSYGGYWGQPVGGGGGQAYAGGGYYGPPGWYRR